MAEDAQPSGGSGLVHTAIGLIAQRIRANELGPGDKLPSESSLAKEWKVSRTVIREAFRSLAAMRLIDLSAGKRATVARIDPGAMSLMIEHGIVTEQINVQQIYDVRRTIETRTVTLAALRRSDEEAKTILEHARAMNANMRRPDRVMEHDLAFHLEIARASRNPIFAMIVGAFQGVSRQSWPIGWKSRALEEERQSMIATHLRIAQAVMSGNPQQASDLMNAHFDDSIKALLSAGIS